MSKGDRILIPTVKGMIVEKTKNILFIQAEGSYSEIFLRGGSRHMISKNMASLCKLLPESDFFRIHASVIVNLQQIKQIKGNEVHLSEGLYFIIAQRRKKEFLEKIKEQSLSF